MREPTQGGGWRSRAAWSTGEPAIDVLFRPKETHRASGEDRVVPPAGRWDQAMKDGVGRPRTFLSDVDSNRFVAIRACSLDRAVDSERRTDAEGVPGAVAVPGPAGGVHPKGGGNRRERCSHPDLTSFP